MYSEQVKESARQAAELLRKDGWRQGIGTGRGEPCCVVVALHYSVDDDDRERAVWDAIKAETGAKDPVYFNDAPDRTAEEVLSVLDRIATS